VSGVEWKRDGKDHTATIEGRACRLTRANYGTGWRVLVEGAPPEAKGSLAVAKACAELVARAAAAHLA